MTEMENLIIAQALFKAFSSAVSTKDPDSLRSRMDKLTIDNYHSTGAKSFDLRLNGQKVGTYSVRLSKPVHRVDLIVTDQDSFAEWCRENGIGEDRVVIDIRGDEGTWSDEQAGAIALLEESGVLVRNHVTSIPSYAMEDAKHHLQMTGELPEGCDTREIDEPSAPIGTLLKVDPTLVAQAMGKELPNAVAGLLTEGAEL